MPEETQHRHHAIDGVEQRRRRRHVAGGERLLERQEIEQELDQSRGIAADVAAVRQDLPLQLLHQPPAHRLEHAGLAGDAQRRIGQRGHGLQPRQPVARARKRAAQITDLAREVANEAPIECGLGFLQHQRRLRQPRDDAPRHDLRPPRQRIPGPLQRDPLRHQRAGVRPGDAGIGGAQMPQPAEAEQHVRPFVGRRVHFERRAAVADHDLAREGETPGVDLARPGRIGGAQVLRRDQQAVGAGRKEVPAKQRVSVEPGQEGAERAARRKQREPRTLDDGPPGNDQAPPLHLDRCSRCAHSTLKTATAVSEPGVGPPPAAPRLRAKRG